MNIDDLLLQVESYIRLRRALGHVIASEEKELKNFIYFFVSLRQPSIDTVL
jgi:hypothetical protein